MISLSELKHHVTCCELKKFKKSFIISKVESGGKKKKKTKTIMSSSLTDACD